MARTRHNRNPGSEGRFTTLHLQNVRCFDEQVTSQAIPRYGRRGRPRADAPPQRIDDHIDGALASAVAARQKLVMQESCFILATNALDNHALSPQEVLTGSKGQRHAERGFWFLKDPQFLASSLSRKKPEHIMALLMVMTVCLLVYAALEYRIRNALSVRNVGTSASTELF